MTHMKIRAKILTTSAAAAAITILAGCGDKGAPAGDAGSEAPAKPAAEAKPAAAPDAKPDAKPEAKAEAKPEAKPAAGGGGSVSLTTEIPPQRIEGTPMPIKVPGLEAALEAAPTLSVPEGTVLLSKGKPVTGSDDFPIIGELDLITDGEKDAGEG